MLQNHTVESSSALGAADGEVLDTEALKDCWNKQTGGNFKEIRQNLISPGPTHRQGVHRKCVCDFIQPGTKMKVQFFKHQNVLKKS